MRMPCEAATPVPTMTAVGVARPSAHGQAMTSTAMPNSSANRNGLCPSGSQSAGYQCRLPATYLPLCSTAVSHKNCRAAQTQLNGHINILARAAFRANLLEIVRWQPKP